MKLNSLSVRVVIMYFVLLGFAGYGMFRVVASEIKPTIRQVTEDTLVEVANLVAEFASPLLVSGDQQAMQLFSSNVQAFLARRFEAKIFDVTKTNADLRIYITDKQGVVIYDSAQQSVGQDFSRWNDVYLTLQGEYGARSTRLNPDDESSSIMYVAAPIYHNQNIIGSLTIAKENASLLPFLALADRNLMVWGGALILLSMLLGAGFSYWLTRSIRKLVAFAEKLKSGEDTQLPKLYESELLTLGDAIKSMRQELTTKEYVESYLLELTHEMKSPLSAISGAAELIDHDMPAEDLSKFVNNIQADSQRLLGFIQKMLEVARLEQARSLSDTQRVKLSDLITNVILRKQIACDQREIHVQFDKHCEVEIIANAFLIQQTLENIMSNSIDFSHAQSCIQIQLARKDDMAVIQVLDEGTGIPDYALDKIFQRFYSLARPQNGVRSSGLGLTFCLRAIRLHRGDISVRNRPIGHGVEVTILLPVT